MNSKKYFFFDIDGTLIPGSGNRLIPENTAKAIQKLKDNGHFCAIATGRARCMAIDQSLAMGFHNMVSDGGNGVIIEDTPYEIIPLPRELCVELINECNAKNIPWAFASGDDPVRSTFFPEFVRAADNSYQKSKVVPEISIDLIPRFIKLFIACSSDEEPDIFALQKLPHVRYNDSFAFVEPTDKSKGIRRIMEHFGASDNDVVVFGDGHNDISMFRPEWTCIAMGNAVPKLKARATFITNDSDDDGIGFALRHFGWI